MPRLTPADVRFQIRRGLQSLSRSTRRDLNGKPEAQERALTVAVETIAARFDGCDIVAPDVDPACMDFGRMKNG